MDLMVFRRVVSVDDSKNLEERDFGGIVAAVVATGVMEDDDAGDAA